MQSVEIRVEGPIDEHWSSWFDDLAVEHTDQGETILSGTIVDQGGAYGLLARLRDLGLPLLSVNCTETETGRSSMDEGEGTE